MLTCPPAVKFVSKYWLIALAWMLLIFAMSTEIGAPQYTSRFITPVLRWFKPAITYPEIRTCHLVIRKCAHGVEYAILAILLCFALRKSTLPKIHGWCWRCAGIALLLCAAYGVGDEIHQYYVARRHAALRDVLIDTAGASIGIFLLWSCHRDAKAKPNPV